MEPEEQKRYNRVLEIIDKRLIPDNTAKKQRGEVFTPLKLVREMLFGLRKDKLEKGVSEIWGLKEDGSFFYDNLDNRVGGIPIEVWRDPKMKWLDPANGIGNFPVVAFYMIDYQLGNHGPAEYKGDKNLKKRRKHIVENMLYMIEIDKGNVNTARKVFRLICPDTTPNIICANTLMLSEEDLKKQFGVNRFDVIMGNPPFQAPQDASRKRGGGDELYMKFVYKMLYSLNDNGFLVFVHPPSWRKPEYIEGRKKSKNAGMFDLMAHQNQIIYLEIHSSKDGMNVFKAGTRYDFYVIKKTPNKEKTIIKDMLGEIEEIDLNKLDFLPNFNFKNVLKMVSSDDTCDLGKCILYERSAYGSDKDWVSAKETLVFKYPLIHTTPLEGPTFYYSIVNNKGFFGIPKVIFGDSGINEPVIDLEGKYGMTQHSMAIVVKNKEDAKRLVIFLKSNFFKNILAGCSWSGFQIDWRLFTYFKNKFWHIDVNLDEKIKETESGTGKSRKSKTAATKGGSYPTRRFTQTRKQRKH